MSILTNGDFSNGLNGWTVAGAGDTAPTFDASTGAVIFGSGNNDVQDGDRLSQQVALQAGQEYTLTFTISEMGAASGGFGLTVDMEDTGGSGFTTIGSATVFDGETNTVSFTFTSPYDDPVLRFRGQFGFGGTDSVLVFDGVSITCFARGTLIATPEGEASIESLSVGDCVETLDAGAQRIRWIGSQRVDLRSIPAEHKLRPVVIDAGAFGAHLPRRDLRISRQHRMLVSSKISERMFSQKEVLVAAHYLTQLPGVRIDSRLSTVEYFHLVLDQHSIIFADGTPSESLYLGKEALKTLDADGVAELSALFPDLVEDGFVMDPARLIPKGGQQKELVARHAKNRKCPLSGLVDSTNPRFLAA